MKSHVLEVKVMNVEYSENGRIAYFGGYKFRRDMKTGYYLSSRATDIGRRERLHCYVWRYFNGEIPTGYHIHHKDENKSHNDIENLDCIPYSEHLSHHSKQNVKKGYEKWVENLKNNAVPKAKEWHKSEIGKAWHKEHYEKMKSKLRIVTEKTCEYCGKTYTTAGNGLNKYCSNNCKSAARRASGIDDEQRKCVICGEIFTCNKYSKTTTCSRECRNTICWDKRHKANRC